MELCESHGFDLSLPLWLSHLIQGYVKRSVVNTLYYDIIILQGTENRNPRVFTFLVK